LARGRVAHVGVTRSPSSAWVTQQLRETTAWGECPRFLIRDLDDKFGTRFDDVAEGTGIKIIRTLVRAPN
jgi:putative transposase